MKRRQIISSIGILATFVSTGCLDSESDEAENGDVGTQDGESEPKEEEEETTGAVRNRLFTLRGKLVEERSIPSRYDVISGETDTIKNEGLYPEFLENVEEYAEEAELGSYINVRSVTENSDEGKETLTATAEVHQAGTPPAPHHNDHPGRREKKRFTWNTMELS